MLRRPELGFHKSFAGIGKWRNIVWSPLIKGGGWIPLKFGTVGGMEKIVRNKG